MKDAYYFSHDSNARNDPKCAALRSKYGAAGYGWFWILIELLRDQPNYKYPLNKYTFDTFAREMQCDRNAVTDFVSDCCHEFADDKSALLCMDENYIWSESLIRRMEGFEKRKESARNAANAKWAKQSCESNATAMQPQCEPNTVKYSKVNNKKDIGDLISDFSENEQLRTALHDFVRMRIKIKKPMTDRAMSNLLNKLNKMTTDITKQIAILDESITKSWSDIYPLKDNSQQQRDHYRRAE